MGSQRRFAVSSFLILLCVLGANAYADQCYKYRWTSSGPTRNTVEEAAEDVRAWCEQVGPSSPYTCPYPYSVYPRNNPQFSIAGILPASSGGGYPNYAVRILSTWTPDTPGGTSQQNNTYQLVTVYVSGQCQAYASAEPLEEAAPKSCKANTVGDPIDPATCTVYHTEVDVNLPGSALAFRRFHASRGNEGSALGPNWRHSFSQRIRKKAALSPYRLRHASPDNSPTYSRESIACVTGFPTIRSRVAAWASATASFENGLCIVKVGGTPIGRVPIYLNVAQAVELPTILNAYEAVREDGQVITFLVNGSTISAPPATPFKLQTTPTGFLLTDPQDTVETYDTEGRLVSLTTRAGVNHAAAYDVSGRLESVTDSFGRALALAYDTQGRLATLTRPDQQTVTYAYDGQGRLSTVTYPGSTSRSYVYEDVSFPNALTGVYDENGQRHATWGYDAQGRATSTTLAGGANAVTLAYNSNGSVTTTDALTAVRTFTFHRRGDRDLVAGVSGSQCPECTEKASTTYDTAGFVTSRTDYRRNLTQYTHNASGLETSRTEAFGTAHARTITTSWHSTFRVPTLITEPNRTTSFTYDAAGNRLTRTVTDTASSASRTWTWTYNGFGQVLTENGPRTDVTDLTTYAYYNCASGAECGQLHTVTNALNQTTTFDTYNAHGRPTQITDPNGVVTTLAYDLRQRLTSRTTAGETTSLEYWPTGLLKKVTLPDGSFILNTYDDAHRLIRVEDGEGNKIEYTLDAMGNRTAENVYDPSSALARTHTRVFNSLGRLWKVIGSAGTSAVTTEFGYDSEGNPTTIDAPLSRDTANLYDELNRLEEVTDPASGVTSFGYDANDNLTSVTDPRSNVTSYDYDGFGDLLELTSPDTGVTTSTYDSAGNLATRTDARNKTGTYSYDALNRLTSIIYPDQTISFTYDAGTNGKGQLTGASDANHSLAFTYDAHGRVTGKSQTVGAVTKSLSYSYANGNLTSLVTPSGQTIAYGYTDGRVTSITLNGSTTILEDVLYEPFGPVAGWTWGNSTIAARIHDLDGKPTDIDSAGAYTYSYDDAFRITGVTDLADGTKSWTYGYDALDQLNAASKTSQTIGYTYDANGKSYNRIWWMS